MAFAPTEAVRKANDPACEGYAPYVPLFVSIEADCNTEVTDDAFWGVTSQISIRQKNLEKTIIAKRDVELSVDLLAKRIGSAKTGQENRIHITARAVG